MPEELEHISVSEYAKRAGISRQAVLQRIKKGSLKAEKVEDPARNQSYYNIPVSESEGPTTDKKTWQGKKHPPDNKPTTDNPAQIARFEAFMGQIQSAREETAQALALAERMAEQAREISERSAAETRAMAEQTRAMAERSSRLHWTAAGALLAVLALGTGMWSWHAEKSAQRARSELLRAVEAERQRHAESLEEVKALAAIELTGTLNSGTHERQRILDQAERDREKAEDERQRILAQAEAEREKLRKEIARLEEQGRKALADQVELRAELLRLKDPLASSGNVVLEGDRGESP